MLLVLPILLPVLFWAGYHYHKDRHLPEPVGNLLLAFGLGLGAAAVSRALYAALGIAGLRFDAGFLAETNPAGLFAYALFAIGPIEESAKLLPFLAVVLRLRAFDERLDGFVYASFIALGYAAAENWQYLPYLTSIEAVARGFVSPVVHIVFASVWAYPVTTARLERRPVLLPALAGLGVAAGLHGFYDFIVLLAPVGALPGAALLVGALWLWRLRLLNRLRGR